MVADRRIEEVLGQGNRLKYFISPIYLHKTRPFLILIGICMKAIVLCGGYAVRLEPVTKFVPKPLLPVGGRPILDYIIKDLELMGIPDIYISTNEKFAPHFEYIIEKERHSKSRMHLVREPTTHNDHKFGAIRGILHAIETAGIDDDFIVIAGDNFYDFSVEEGLKNFKRNGVSVICLYALESVEQAKRFGVVEVMGDKIVSFEEKPANPKTNLISTGIYIFNKKVIPELRAYIKDNNNPDSPGYFIKWLVDRRFDLECFVVKGSWYDIGTVETYEHVFERYKNKNGSGGGHAPSFNK